MKVLHICGSRNKEGQTASAGKAFVNGMVKSGISVEDIFLPSIQLERCRQCDDDGWGLCRKEGRCVIADDFGMIVDKIVHSDGIVITTPVYYSDLSESLKTLTDRLRRTCWHEAGKNRLKDKPLVGICVAGGGGGGSPECCMHLTKVASICGFNVIDMFPVRRQNLQAKLQQLETAGAWFAAQLVR